MRVDAGTVIELAACNGCGRGVLVKANKNGIAYYYCNGQGAEDHGGCSHHEKWGRAASQDKIRAYYAAQKGAAKSKGSDNVKHNPGQPEAATVEAGEAGAGEAAQAGGAGAGEADKAGGLGKFFKWE